MADTKISDLPQKVTVAGTEQVPVNDAGTTRRQDTALYLARANHTGTQALATVAGLPAALDAKLPVPRLALDGAFVYHPGVTDAELDAQLGQLAQLGIRTIALSETRLRTAGVYSWVSGMPARLGTILDAALRAGLDCLVGLTFSAGDVVAFHDEPTRSQDAADTTTAVSAILASYGTHPALAGWYVINEAALAYHTDPATLVSHDAYYLAIRNAIRALDATRTIMTSPYLANHDGLATQDPSDVAAKALAFKNNTGGDLIQAWQDSVQGDAQSIGWSRDSRTIGAYFDAIAAAIGDRFWSNTELGTWAADAFNNGGYHAAPATRVMRQLLLARPAARRFGWLPQIQMGDVAAGRKPDAPRLLAAYRALTGLEGELAVASAYAYTQTPIGGQGDGANKLFDRLPGDPKSATDSNWVGFANGGVTVAIDMGLVKTVNWVGVQCLHLAASTIAFPDSLQIEHSQDGSTWANIGTFALIVTKGDGEFVLSHPTALGVACRHLRLTLVNAAAKTYLGQVEIVANQRAADRPQYGTLTQRGRIVATDAAGEGFLTLGTTQAIELRNYQFGNDLWITRADTAMNLRIGTSFDYDRQVNYRYTPGTTGAGAGVLDIGQVDKAGGSWTHGLTKLWAGGAERLRVTTTSVQAFVPVQLPAYTVATRPAAASFPGGLIYVSDGGSGAVIQASNGSTWVSLG